MEDLKTNEIVCNFCKEKLEFGYSRCPYCGSILKDNLRQASIYYKSDNDENISENEESNELDNENKDDDLNSNINFVLKSYDEYKKYQKEESMLETDSNDKKKEVSSDMEVDARPMSNSIKVFLTAITTCVPGFGQLIGVIIAIVLMSADDNKDRNSFGKALMVNSLIFFILSILYLAVIGSIYKALR